MINIFNAKTIELYPFNSRVIIIFILVVIFSFQLLIVILNFNRKEKDKTLDIILKINNTDLTELYLYKKDEIIYENNKNEIPIAMAFNNEGVYPALVSMTSALENNNKDKNILVYFLLLSYDFNKKNIKILESLKQKYQVKINYYIIPNMFKHNKKWFGNQYTIYYKILIPLMFPFMDKIIYLDGDTLVYKDLLEMYSLPFNNNYILGYPFHTPYILNRFDRNIKIINYINAGVILINIKEIRKNNKGNELLKFTLKNSNKLLFLEQDALNYVFNGKIGLLPYKYGIYLYGNYKEAKENYLWKLRMPVNLKEVKIALEDPAIVHFCCCTPKIWKKNTKHERGFNHICYRFQKDFYNYANKTNYYLNIYKKYMK